MRTTEQQVQGARNILCKRCHAKGIFTRIGCMAGVSPLSCVSCGSGESDHRVCPPKEAENPMMVVCLTCTGNPNQVYADIEKRNEKKKKEKKEKDNRQSPYRPGVRGHAA